MRLDQTCKFTILVAIATCVSPQIGSGLVLAAETAVMAQAPSSAQQLYQEGLTLFNQGSQAELNQALTKLEAALQAPDIETNLPLQASIYQTIGILYFTQNDFAKALQAHQDALTRYQQLNDELNLASQLALTAMTHLRLGDYPQVITLSEQALNLLESRDQDDLKASIYHNLGTAYHRLGQVNQSIEALQSALVICQKQGQIQEQASLWEQLSLMYLGRGEFPKARAGLNQSLTLSRQVKDTLSEAQTLMLLATLASASGDYAQAIDHLETSRQRYEQLAESSTGDTLTQVQRGQITVLLASANALENTDQSD